MLMKKIVSFIQWIVILVLFLAITLLLTTAFNPVKKFQVLRVMSGSMEPEIKVGSVIFVTKTDISKLRERDIITFNATDSPEMSVTHRIAEIVIKDGKTIFRTKGDANKTADATEVPAQSVKGKVLFALPFLGYVSVFVKKPLGFILLVILPALLLIINEIFNIKKTIEEEVKKKYEKQNEL